MIFNIVVISKNQDSFLENMVKQLDIQFPGIRRIFVLDRCEDVSVALLKSLKEPYIENKEGKGFLAGKMRDIGLSYLGVENTFFLDGDRIPVNFSTPIISKALELYDMCLSSIEIDPFRKRFFKDFFTLNLNQDCAFTCGLCIRKEMIKKILTIQGGRLFHPAFDGVYGEEDAYLADVVLYLNGTCGLFPVQHYLTGSFSGPKNRMSFELQQEKRKKMRNVLFEKGPVLRAFF